MKNTHYFIKDEAISDSKQDFFNYIDYVNNIKKIITDNNPPFNIAIIGKWGVGKSSIVNMLKKEFEANHEYQFYEINAWKYENTSLRKAFLKQLYTHLNKGKNLNQYSMYIENLKNTKVTIVNENEKPKDFIKNTFIRTVLVLLSFVLLSFILLLISILLDYLIFKVSNDLSFHKAWLKYIDKNSINNIIDTVKTSKNKIYIPVAVIIISQLSKFFSDYKMKHVTEYNVNPPIAGADEYEDMLKETLNEYKKRHKYFKKLIITVEDLDRLSTKKIVDALDAIKAFVEVEECIFIVPFDDSILREAITSEKTNDNSTIEGNLYLDKLFQFKIILPPLIDMDMREYAYNLCKKEVPEIFNIVPNFKSILENILIYSDVTTPRQIKKIINIFVNNFLISKDREKNKKLESNLITSENGLRVLAKVSVLQSDFPEFYEKLLDDRNLIRKLLEEYANIDRDKESEKNEINNYTGDRSLINFLIRTQYIRSDNLSPYIYLKQDSLGLEAGDKKQRAIRKDLLNGNYTDIIKLSSERKLDSADIKIIMYGINSTGIVDLMQSIKVGIQIIDYVQDDMLEEFSNLISHKLDTVYIDIEGDFRYWEIDFKNYMKIYMFASEKTGIEKIIYNAIKKLFNRIDSWEQKDGSPMNDEIFDSLIYEYLDICLNNNNNLSQGIKSFIKNFINDSSNYPVEKLINLYDKHSDLIDEYFADNFYNRLCSSIISGTDEDKNLNEEFKAFEEIAATVRTHDIQRFSKPLKYIINSENNALMVCKILAPVASDIPVTNSNELLNGIITFNYSEGFNNIVNVMCDLNWEIDNVENDKLNEFIINSLQDGHIKEIKKLITGKLKDTFNHLNKVAKFIGEQCLENDDFKTILSSIINFYTVDQLQSTIDSAYAIVSAYNNFNDEKFKKAYFIIECSLKNENSNKLLSDKVTTLLKYIVPAQTYVTSYPKWGEALIGLIGSIKDNLNSDVFKNYVNTLISLENRKPDLMVMGLRYIGVSTPNEYKKNAIDAVIRHISSYTDDVKVLAATYLNDIKDAVNEKTNNLGSCADFLIGCISADANTIMTYLKNMYSSLGKERVIQIMNHFKKDKILNKCNKNLIINTLYEFFSAENFEDKVCILQSFLNLCTDDASLQFVKDLLNKDIKITVELINSLMEKLSEDDNFTYLIELLKLNAFYRDKTDKKNTAQLILHIFKLSTDEEIITLCNILVDKYTKYKLSYAKHILSENIIDIFIKHNLEAKKNILEVVKIFAMEKLFKNTPSDIEFKDEEKKIIKENLHINI
ncbi:KAP family P-loop NTPase fold protein [Clostridium tyrobutyricum]|uniref:KAP family P-loop NTPase fold protein n=2 Tax=Clostridium tyrobutyricum TaxID=1519 RepID=UPI0018ABAB36|nr:P-loop NTPase fold protein [Clostridium tyrobutyricum]